MVKEVDDFLEQEMVREDAVAVMIGSGYGDLIDLMTEEPHKSIFDNESTITEGGNEDE